MNLIKGESVVVTRVIKGFDDLGEPIPEREIKEQVDNVVVAPQTAAELDATRPNGAKIAFTLCFPKTYTKDLYGCMVKVRGKTYRVVGDPQSWTVANTPTPWNYTVEVEAVNG